MHQMNMTAATHDDNLGLTSNTTILALQNKSRMTKFYPPCETVKSYYFGDPMREEIKLVCVASYTGKLKCWS